MIDFSSLPAVVIAREPRPELPANASRIDRAWHVLHGVLDPEVPALSVCDLGIVRDVRDRGNTLEVELTPTYSGCPATEVIERDVIDALEAAGLGPVTARTVLSPAWTSDWISEDGKRKLREYGIAPPGRCGSVAAGQPAEHIVRLVRNPSTSSGRTQLDGASPSTGSGRTGVGQPGVGHTGVGRTAVSEPIACPRCDSTDTERLSAFGATACKSLYRCRACREPFEAFKAI